MKKIISIIAIILIILFSNFLMVDKKTTTKTNTKQLIGFKFEVFGKVQGSFYSYFFIANIMKNFKSFFYNF